MKLEGTVRMRAPQAAVWDALNNPAALERATPGCKRFETTEDGTYHVQLELGIAAIRGVYEGNIALRDVVPPSSYLLEVDGSGAAGFVQAQVRVMLTQEGKGTLLTYNGEAQVGGTIAGVGQRVLGGVAKLLIGDFFKKIEAEARGAG